MHKNFKIESRLENISIVENEIDSTTNQIGISEYNYGKILISTLEAVNNAILHGNGSNPEKFVDIDIAFYGNNLKIMVKDEGLGFKPYMVPDPTLPENIEEPNGRGVFLMKRLADEIKFNRKGNSVTMVFKNIRH
jgi:serine/threonine-protein kinase RsbW